MTDKKILSPAEALRALADGKKLTREGWNKSWIQIQDYKLLRDGGTFPVGNFDDFYEYTEPASKVVWVEYLCICKIPATTTVGHTSWYQDGFEKLSSWDYTPTGRKIEV